MRPISAIVGVSLLVAGLATVPLDGLAPFDAAAVVSAGGDDLFRPYSAPAA